MANGERIPIMELEVQLSEDILLHDRAGLWATFVHLEGHEAQRIAVHEAVTQAVTRLYCHMTLAKSCSSS